MLTNSLRGVVGFVPAFLIVGAAASVVLIRDLLMG
jgi:hypothetical protein